MFYIQGLIGTVLLLSVISLICLLCKGRQLNVACIECSDIMHGYYFIYKLNNQRKLVELKYRTNSNSYLLQPFFTLGITHPRATSAIAVNYYFLLLSFR